MDAANFAGMVAVCAPVLFFVGLAVYGIVVIVGDIRKERNL